MASPGYDVSTSCVILIPRETSARQKKWVSAQLKERARARATSCWSWVWGEDQRERQNEDPQLELGTFAAIKADPGQVFWSAQAPTDCAAPAPPTADDDTMFLGVVPSPDADLTSMASPQVCAFSLLLAVLLSACQGTLPSLNSLLSSGSLAQVLLLEPDVGRPRGGRLGEMGVDELGLPCPCDDKQKLNSDLIFFYPYRATTLAIVLTSWRRPSKRSLLKESGQASAHESGSHQATCTPDPLSPSLGLSHQLRVCDNFLNSSMVLCLRYHRIGVQREARGERKA
ncbi:Golgin subfamily A member 2 [Lemmus lemmus]